jgi:hypothetical protein
MIDFYNLNADYYQSTYGIEKRDYFEFEKMKERAIKVNDQGKASIADLSANAHDLLSMKK